MIKENQRLLNQLNTVSDGILAFLVLPFAYWLRFYVIPDVVPAIPFRSYLILAAVLAFLRMFVYAFAGLYRSFRSTPIKKELSKLLTVDIIIGAAVLSYLFLNHSDHFSRLTLGLYLLICFLVLSGKRIILRLVLRSMRKRGFNRKYVLIIGSSSVAEKYISALKSEKSLGYYPIGFISSTDRSEVLGIPYLGDYDRLEDVLNKTKPDEAVSAIDSSDFSYSRKIIEACEKTGTKLAIIPFYAEYITSALQFDELNGIPLLNIRKIPLDNWANAFVKRAADIIISLLLIIISSPIMLFCAIGVRLSSPGPIIFRQKRVGLNKAEFDMYKFRSMRINSHQENGWSSTSDSRKTRFGSFIRKFSLDEFPQFFNVLRGDMSLIGPRPEVPFYVDRFKDEIPLYMVKHQVRPGITGWAQVNGFRGDTSIKGRIELDIYYIEHWSVLFDFKILFMTLFGGKFINSEKLKGADDEQ